MIQLGTIAGGILMMVDPKPKRTVLQRVRERDAAGLCLHDDCEAKAEKRGCCGKHYQRFRSQLVKLPPEKQAEYEAKCIREGLILADRQGQRFDIIDRFRQLALGEE